MMTAEAEDEMVGALRKHREAYRELEQLHEGLKTGDDYPPGIVEATQRVQEAWSAYLDARRRRWEL